MSFLYLNGAGGAADSLVLLAQKRHYHEVQKYNKEMYVNRMEAKRSLKMEINGKYSRINQEVADSLNVQGRVKRKEKSIAQSILKNAYEEQIRLKEQRSRLQRESERQYAKMYTDFIESSNERRVFEQLGRYRTPSLHAVRERVQSQASYIQKSKRLQPQPQSLNPSQKGRIFLPALSRPNQPPFPEQKSSQSLRRLQPK